MFTAVWPSSCWSAATRSTTLPAGSGRMRLQTCRSPSCRSGRGRSTTTTAVAPRRARCCSHAGCSAFCAPAVATTTSSSQARFRCSLFWLPARHCWGVAPAWSPIGSKCGTGPSGAGTRASSPAPSPGCCKASGNAARTVTRSHGHTVTRSHGQQFFHRKPDVACRRFPSCARPGRSGRRGPVAATRR